MQPDASEPSVTIHAARRAGVVRRSRLRSGTTVAEHWWPDDHVIVSIAGELDHADCGDLIDALTGCVLAGARRVDVDLLRVTFADVAALRAIATVRSFLLRVGGDLSIRGASPRQEYVWALVAEPVSGPVVGVLVG